MSNDWEFETGKHWLSYVALLFRYAIILAFSCGLFLAIFVSSSKPESLKEVVTLVFFWAQQYMRILLPLAVSFVAKFIYDFFYLRSYRWKVSNRGVNYSFGILPWRKYSWFQTYTQIFDASFSRGFLGWLLNYGTIHIRGKEGTTSHTAQSMVANAKHLQAKINQYLQS